MLDHIMYAVVFLGAFAVLVISYFAIFILGFLWRITGRVVQFTSHTFKTFFKYIS